MFLGKLDGRIRVVEFRVDRQNGLGQLRAHMLAKSAGGYAPLSLLGQQRIHSSIEKLRNIAIGKLTIRGVNELVIPNIRNTT